MVDCIYEAKNFKLVISETGGPDSVCLGFEGSCSSQGFLSNADEVIEKLKNIDYRNIFIDTDALKRINSRFIGLLIVLVGSGRNIGLKTPDRFLNDLLEMTGILNKFHVYSSFKEFEDACGQKNKQGE